jgi:hypothetical protein
VRAQDNQIDMFAFHQLMQAIGNIVAYEQVDFRILCMLGVCEPNRPMLVLGCD